MRWNSDSAVTVVMAANGYPGSYAKGSQIDGADQLESPSGCLVFHAGTKRNNDGQLTANGGRVLCVTAMGTTVSKPGSVPMQGCRNHLGRGVLQKRYCRRLDFDM